MKTPLAYLSIFILLISAALLSGENARAASWQTRVDPWVLETAAAGETEFIVFMAEQAHLGAAHALPDKVSKGRFVYETLTAAAARTQGPVLAALDALGAEHRPYWVANFIWVRADLTVVQAMAARADVAHIYANPWVRLDLGPPPAEDPVEDPEVVEWNLVKVNADDVWAAGIVGEGAVLAGQDTGYDWDHPALIYQYRGWNGGTADHDYNWHDAIHSGGGICGPNSPFPCDDHGHGTHTMGTIVGDDFNSIPNQRNQVGMAPGARWIGCRNMNVGFGTPTTYSECFQWFIAPTEVGGGNPNPSLAPDAINNSWSCPPSEGCTDPNVLKTVVENTRAAGILVVASAGNSGPNCSSVSTPPSIYAAAFGVGATDSGDGIASFSSRGPVTIDGSSRLKPQVSAPGVNIRSSVPGGGYQGGWSGTSMAGPHVAGLAGLLIDAVPSLAGNVDQLESLITQSAVPLTSGQTCGGVPGSQVPNNTFGYGRIDAWAAYQLAISGPPTPTPTATDVPPTPTPTPTATATPPPPLEDALFLPLIGNQP